MLGTIVIVGLIYAVGVLSGMVIMEVWHHRLRRELEYAKAAVRWRHKG